MWDVAIMQRKSDKPKIFTKGAC